MTDRPYFCTLPWTGLDVNAQGIIRPCCKFSADVSDNLQDYYQSEILHQVRETFLQGGKPQQCRRCWQEEAAGLPSKRQLMHQHVLAPDTALENVKTIALTFGNICNLACVPCNSSSSSRWLQDERKLVQGFGNLGKMFTHNTHYKDQDFVDAIIECSEHIEYLEISGGEPFLSNRDLHLDLLARIPHPEKVKIHYVTNGTIFPDPEFWETWRVFRHVDMQVSIDATGKRFEYLRYPASWPDVLANVRRYRDATEIQLSISHTVSWINLLGLDDFVIWCLKERLPLPYIGPVRSPNFLSVQSLPQSAKDYVQGRLGNGKWLGTKQIIDYMNLQDQSEFFDQGLEWLRALDRLRNQDCWQVFPELAPLIDTR